MLVVDLDGNRHDWRVKGREVVIDHRRTSSLHKDARALIKQRFPTLQVLEEVPFNPRKGRTQYLDFYLPLRKLAIEVHGEQHFSYNSHFHATRQDFMRQKKRDRDKTEWCEINGITLIVLSCLEKDEWQNKI